MGIFKSLFGGNDDGISSADDWLQIDRRADYLPVGQMGKNLTLELSAESCVTLNENTWFVARYRETIPHGEEKFVFFVGLIEKGYPEVVIMVDRVERADGKTIRKDRWLPYETLHSKGGSVIEKLKGSAQNFAQLWAYTSPPPYVTAVLSRIRAKKR